MLQSWSEAMQAACSHLPDEQLSPAAELHARSNSAALLDEAVQTYQQVQSACFAWARMSGDRKANLVTTPGIGFFTLRRRALLLAHTLAADHMCLLAHDPPLNVLVSRALCTQVRQPPEAKEDARINCGNALSAWAQLELDGAKRVQLLRLALRAYASATDSSEDSAVGL